MKEKSRVLQYLAYGLLMKLFLARCFVKVKIATKDFIRAFTREHHLHTQCLDFAGHQEHGCACTDGGHIICFCVVDHIWDSIQSILQKPKTKHGSEQHNLRFTGYAKVWCRLSITLKPQSEKEKQSGLQKSWQKSWENSLVQICVHMHLSLGELENLNSECEFMVLCFQVICNFLCSSQIRRSLKKNNKIQHPSSHEDQSSPNACDLLKFAATKKLRTELNLLQ